MKQRKCKVCREPSTMLINLHAFCTYDHAIEWANKQTRKAYKAETVRRKRELLDNDKSHWMKLAQKEFNAYIRARDKGLPCVSCGRHHQGQYHAGHYRSIGACAALRFDERQVRLQCAPCNNHLSGNIAKYRVRLIELIGVEQVEEIENYNEIKRFTIDDLKHITKEYKEKRKLLEHLV